MIERAMCVHFMRTTCVHFGFHGGLYSLFLFVILLFLTYFMITFVNVGLWLNLLAI